MILITITNIYCQISGSISNEVIKIIDHRLSYMSPGYLYAHAFKTGRWDGRVRLFTKQLKFQTGLLPEVQKIFEQYDIEYTIVDQRQDVVLGEEIKFLPTFHKLRPYQEEILNVAIKHKYGLIKAATGAGKTSVIAALVGRLNIKAIVYVISIDLLYDMKKTIEDALGVECGIIGNGIYEFKKINVATLWTAVRALDEEYDPFDDEQVVKEDLDNEIKNKIKNVIEEAEIFIIDEAQIISSSSAQLITKASKKAAYRLGFSATPWRDDGTDMALTAATGPQLIDINATTLINDGFLVKPQIVFFKVPEVDGINKSNKIPYQKIYDQYVVENQVRNEIIIEAATKLYQRGNKTLILVKHKKHGLKLLEMMPKEIRSYFITGDASADERQAVKELFMMDGLDIIIASSIYDQGVSIEKLDALVLAGSGKSSIKSLQRVGRILRLYPGKEKSTVVDFIDTCPYLFEHSKKRYLVYKTEPAFQIKLPENFKW